MRGRIDDWDILYYILDIPEGVMASLYIKDAETAELAARVAKKLNQTKTEVVRNLLRKADAELEPAGKAAALIAWLDEEGRKYPLPPPTGLKADKAFFDAMWDED